MCIQIYSIISPLNSAARPGKVCFHDPNLVFSNEFRNFEISFSRGMPNIKYIALLQCAYCSSNIEHCEILIIAKTFR